MLEPRGPSPEALLLLADRQPVAERLLAATGQGVALCPNYGVGTTANPAPNQLLVHGDAEEVQ